MVVFNDLEDVEKIRIYDKGVTLPYDARQLPFETDRFQDFHLSYRYGGVSIPYVPMAEPLRRQCEHFLDSVRTSARPQSDGVVGMKVVRLIEAADRSLRSGGLRETVPGPGVPRMVPVPSDETELRPADAAARSSSGTGAHTSV
jgi:hypothetical protein